MPRPRPRKEGFSLLARAGSGHETKYRYKNAQIPDCMLNPWDTDGHSACLAIGGLLCDRQFPAINISPSSSLVRQSSSRSHVEERLTSALERR